MARNGVGRWAGPPAVAALALLLGAVSAGYTWVLVRHLRDDARETSRLLGRVFVGLNDPRPDAATDALLELATQVRALGIPIAVTDTTGRITALDNQPGRPGGDADTAHLREWIAQLDAVNAPIVQPGVGTIQQQHLVQESGRGCTVAASVVTHLQAPGRARGGEVGIVLSPAVRRSSLPRPGPRDRSRPTSRTRRLPSSFRPSPRRSSRRSRIARIC